MESQCAETELLYVGEPVCTIELHVPELGMRAPFGSTFWDIEVTFVDRYTGFMCRFGLEDQCAAQSFCVSGSCSRSTYLCVSERQYASQSFFV